VTWVDTSANSVVTLPIELSSNFRGGSNFVVNPSTLNSVYYTGTGFLNNGTVSMQLKRRYTNGSYDVVNFSNYIKQ
jgi:hypothetical protein